ncbi:PREDICTED: adhesion G protein-coupled receptor L3-like [Amphimedon queenslandica]|uniref:G-protein coupled receptors family 2 profile 1 domain-containing protein n=1 Tax=Amphimedon queenslandica TaxID=400682 RepID=A0AAN0JJ91_AMPQE|nr:PREDICTED: adhesion G protein-coupled receptor L3-like [Amphimedon queenslandica]|eukprot:XP_019857100.1 PREDICTED: adhesion G protein-coupled receptor L3-like [Amphimedon queenslandica]
MLLLLLPFSLLFAGGSSDTVTLKFNLGTSADCVVGDPVVTLWVETLRGGINYLMTYNGSQPGINTQYKISVNYSRPTTLYFHWIDCNQSSIFCFPLISSVTIENDVNSPLTVSICTKVFRRLSSTRIEFDSSNGILVSAGSGSCNSTGPYCSNSSKCCLPSPAVFSSHSSVTSSLIYPTTSFHTSSSSLSSSSTLASPKSTSMTLSSIPLKPSSVPSIINPSISLLLPTSTSVPTRVCHPQTNTNDHGQFKWPLTLAGMTVTILCPSGPIGATASRICSTSSDWESQDVMRCATTDVTNGFIELSKVNITVDNFGSAAFNMSSLVENATRTLADQNIQNIDVISTVLEAIVSVLLKNESLPLIIETTGNIVQTLNLLVEWPMDVTNVLSNNIIQSFEGFIQVVFEQENFAVIKIAEENILFRAERFARANFSGLTISACAFNKELNFSTSDSLSSLTFITKVILPKNIKNVTSSENIDVASTLYKKANFFPVRKEVNSSSSVMTVVGSAVISIIVGGIPDGTELIDPVTIILALNEENVTNPRCAFWNFTGADGIGNWSIDGCTTVVDSNDLNNEYRKPWKAHFVQCFPRTTIHSDYKSGPSNKSTKGEDIYIISNHATQDLNDIKKEEIKDASL